MMANHVVYLVYDQYWIPCYVSIYSLLKNNKQEEFKIYIISEEKNYERYFKNIDPLNSTHDDFSIEFINVSQSTVGALPKPQQDRFGRGVNLKLLFEDLLPIKNDNFLYLDPDTIVNGDITQFLSKDMSNLTVAACQDYSPQNIVGLGVPLTKQYFNAGVMLINMRSWRENDIKNKCIKFIEEYNPLQNEQTALNAILHRSDLVDIVSLEYNFHPTWYYGEGNGEGSILLNEPPKIIHYWGSSRPWYYKNSELEFTDIWLTYYKDTPFTDFYPLHYRPRLVNYFDEYLKSTPRVHSFVSCTYKYLCCLNVSVR